jgi:PKD-like domain/Secretion system C-terminal sorting domain/Pregnancy-associated plasma protein-A
MSNKFLTLSFFLFVLAEIKAQEICLTPLDNKIQNEYETKLKRLKKTKYDVSLASAQSNIYVNVVFHIQSSSVTSEATAGIISSLNSAFNIFNIYFVKICDNFYAPSADLTNARLPYAINIFIADTNSALADGVGSNAFFIRPIHINTPTIPHEMGHCLNLFHTHNERGCLELIDGSNCLECGDHVCDTPADPMLYNRKPLYDENCVYIGTATQDGVPYNPDTHNYMSYSGDDCRNRFSPQQGERMYNSLLTLNILQATYTYPQIIGPKLFCTNATYTQTIAPINSMISWSVTPANLVTPSSGFGSVANLSKLSNGNAVITFRNGCYATSFSFHTGPYSSSDYPISGPTSVQCKSNVYYSVPTLSGTTSINWVWPSGWSYVSGQNSTQLALRTNSSGGAVQVGVNNICGGSGSYTYKYTSVIGSCPFSSAMNTLSISPNPASNEVTISFEDTTNSSQDFESTYDIKIYNQYQELVHSTQSSKNVLTIPTTNFPDGTYFLNIINKEGIIQRRMFIKKNH